MPIYTIENIDNGEIEDIMVSYDEFQKFLLENKNYRQIIKPLNIADPIGIGVKKPPSDFLKYVVGKAKTAPGAHNPALEKRWHIPKEI